MIEPRDHIGISILTPELEGRRLTAEEFEGAAGQDGYRFELVNGVLHVSPAPNLHAKKIALAIYRRLFEHRDRLGERVFGMVLIEPRVLIRTEPENTTNPEPDVAAYDTPAEPFENSFEGLSPVLVVEVVSPDSADKDYRRNLQLYGSVDGIIEYWIVDPTSDAARPSLTVHKRAEGHLPFECVDIDPGGTYEPERWPELKIELRRIAVE